eukprot:m.151542 g.151542  ORF g.151542 m.151542 type:complete len:687 (+) comp15094_c1_seq4:61-2121(+)
MAQRLVLPTFYVPVHSVASEQVAAFLSRAQTTSKIFIYPFHTDFEVLETYYQQNFRVVVYPFTFESVVRELQADTDAHRDVAVLLTSSGNYVFGSLQRILFDRLKLSFPCLVDVFGVGHCLYGCTSCSHHEHRVPLYFTRFYNDMLPYKAQDLAALFAVAGRPVVVVAPSFGARQIISSDALVSSLIALQSRRRDLKFILKLHPACFLSPSHPLHGLSPTEQDNVDRLREAFDTVPGTLTNILPLLELASAIVADLESSISFECMYFERKAIYAYLHPEDSLARYDANYLSLLTVFRGPDTLEPLFEGDVSSRAHDGRAFFKEVYGVVDGEEVEKTAAIRWAKRSAPMPPLPISYIDVLETLQAASDETGGTFSPWPFLVLGQPLPAGVREYHVFVTLHETQLVQSGIPLELWPRLHDKLVEQTFDAGAAFCFDEDGALVAAVEEGLRVGADVWLIDHAWTTAPAIAASQLRSYEGLLQRVCSLLNIDAEDQDTDDVIEQVLARMPEVAQSYFVKQRVPGSEEAHIERVWFLEDEVGSAISTCETISAAHTTEPTATHTSEPITATTPEPTETLTLSDTPIQPTSETTATTHTAAAPTAAVSPFVCLTLGGMAFSVLWLLRPLDHGEAVTRRAIDNTASAEAWRTLAAAAAAAPVPAAAAAAVSTPAPAAAPYPAASAGSSPPSAP